MATWSANVPPVRRIGQRESLKENIEAAECARLAKVIETMQASLEADVGTLLTKTETAWTTATTGLDGCIAQTELKT